MFGSANPNIAYPGHRLSKQDAGTGRAMPKVKSEKREAPAAAAPYELKNGGGGEEEGGVGTVPTAGFRDAERARQTLDALRERDATYQFNVVNSLHRRAKTILSRTKDAEKVTNLTEAIKIFDDWLNDYKAHNRSREQFNYLPLETIEAYIPLAEHYSLKKDFVQVFQDIKGDSRLLRTTKVPPAEGDEETVTWDIKRNRHLKELTGRVNKEYLPLFEFDPPLRGLPTSEHCEMIMWGYSPEPTKVKKCIPQIAEKLNTEH